MRRYSGDKAGGGGRRRARLHIARRHREAAERNITWKFRESANCIQQQDEEEGSVAAYLRRRRRSHAERDHHVEITVVQTRRPAGRDGRLGVHAEDQPSEVLALHLLNHWLNFNQPDG